MNEVPPADESVHRPSPPPRIVLGVFIAIVVGLNVLGLVVSATWPTLVKDHPLLLITLSNRYRFLLLTRNRIDAGPQIVIGVLRNLASDPVYFLLGWWYGDRVLGLFRKSMGKGAVAIETTERWFRRYGDAIVFLTPSPFVCALAGASGMRARRFWPVNIVGTIVMVSGVRLLGSLVESPVNAFLRFNERYNKWLLVAVIASTVFLVMTAGIGTQKVETLKAIDTEARAAEEAEG